MGRKKRGGPEETLEKAVRTERSHREGNWRQEPGGRGTGAAYQGRAEDLPREAPRRGEEGVEGGS